MEKICTALSKLLNEIKFFPFPRAMKISVLIKLISQDDTNFCSQS